MFNNSGAAMVRYRVVPYPHNPQLMWITARRLTAVVAPEVAARFEVLVKRARPRGWWQLKLLLELAKHGRVAADAAHWVRGRAASYEGRYQASLDAVMSRAGARYVPGPRGGRWAAYYELVGDGD
jgi:hypothetical protein